MPEPQTKARPRRWSAAAGVLCVAAGVSLALAAACASGNGAAELERAAAVNAEAAVRAQLLAALEPLDPLRYHEQDGIIRNEGRIPAAALVWAARARETLAWVDWPAELEDHVEQYAEWLDSLLDAMHDDDAEAAAEPSRIVHALAHTFEAALEAWLNGRTIPAPPPLAGLEPPAHDGHDGGSMSE